MRKRLSISILIFVLLFFPNHAYAQFPPQQDRASTTVKAAVGEYYLSVSGYISPYASIVLTSDGLFYRATVADEHGNFSLSNILIRRGFTGFCLEAVDFKRLGESVTCFSFSPAKGNIIMKDIFLPPTIGLQRAEIAAGSDALVFGYTMPGAIVTIHLQGDITFTVTADSTGYYEYTIKNLAAGQYQLFANAQYRGKKSENPSKTLALKALSFWEQLMRFLRMIWKWLLALPLGPLWFGLPVLIIIFILVVKLWPERFTWIYNSKLVYFFMRHRKRKLHHAWFVGY